MASSDLADYYQEVFNFLSSMTIKFTPLADALNQMVLNKGVAVDATDPTSWKYYLNLTGQYHSTDTPITITSLDTQQPILFSPANLALHPKTAAAYLAGQPLYTALRARYPDQADLIKSIVYPVADLTTAITAEEFTILAYSTTALEANEYDIVLQTMVKYLHYINRRWYFNFFAFEPYYHWVFWGQLWQQMVLVVLLARILAIKTANVHSWHIWQYLASYGLADYSDVLNRTQQLFLYRNIAYLIANRGKDTNLVILADNLLSGLGVGLYGLDIWQSTLDGAATAQNTPELVPVGIPTKFINALPAETAETVTQIEQRLFAMGTEVDISDATMAQLTTQVATTPLNTMPTKLLELRQVSTDLTLAAYLNHFLLDSLIYAVAKGLYTTAISVQESTTQTVLSLNINEALVLYSYCAFRALLQTPTELPTQYTVTAAFQTNPTLPTRLAFDGYTYPLTDFTNVANYLGNYAWPTTPSLTPTAFTAILSTQFLAAVNQILISGIEEDTITNHALQALSDAVTVNETIPLNLASVSTYSEWLVTQPPALVQMFAILDAQSDPSSAYDDLANEILSALLPATPTFTLYGNFALTGTAYSKFKDLFVQLCSYNILFLDKDTTVQTGIFLGKTSSYTKSRTLTQTTDIPITKPLQIEYRVTDSHAMPPVALQMWVKPQLHVRHQINTAVHLKHSYEITGQHRIALGSDVHIPAATHTGQIRAELYHNDSYFLTPIPAG